MIELMITLSIISMLVLAAFFVASGQLVKGRDAKRKADLNKMQKLFEDYLNDASVYPAVAGVSDSNIVCNGGFSPYLSQLPCDPKNNDELNYYYEVDSTRDWYVIYASLENEEDSIIDDKGCESGCGPGASYNYWVASPNIAVLTEGGDGGDGDGDDCVAPEEPAIGPGGICNPSNPCIWCSGSFVCAGTICCRPRLPGECE